MRICNACMRVCVVSSFSPGKYGDFTRRVAATPIFFSGAPSMRQLPMTRCACALLCTGGWLVMARLQMLAMMMQLAVVMTSVSVSLDDVDTVSCLAAKRHCLADALCRPRLETLHEVCGDNSKQLLFNFY